jgi:hypothetical protein
VTEIRWEADVTGPVAVFVDVAGGLNWSAFVVERAGWVPTPGLSGPQRFRVTSEQPASLHRRWTGDAVDPASAPPDHYLLDETPVDVYDDVHVRADGTVERSALPWPYVAAAAARAQNAPKRS